MLTNWLSLRVSQTPLNWPRDTDRYRRVERFVDAFFSKFAEFQKPAERLGPIDFAADGPPLRGDRKLTNPHGLSANAPITRERSGARSRSRRG